MKSTDKAILKLNYDSNGKEWKMAKDSGMAQGPGHYPKVDVKYDNLGEFTFVIQNPKGLTFAATDPFVPKAGKSNPADFAAQFEITGAGTGTLVVKDHNANPKGSAYAGGDYHYELHFSNGTTLDPIVTNGGCCSSGGSGQNSLIYFGLGAVALLALFILVVRPLLARR